MTGTDVWKKSVSAYMISKGVHQPWICEISPAQMGSMSDRQKENYFKKRQKEWDASAQCKEEYAAEVTGAFDRGEVKFSDPELHPDAKSAYLTILTRREKEEYERRLEQNRQNNDIRAVEEIKIGDKVFHIVHRKYCTVSKMGRKGSQKVFVKMGEEEIKTDVGLLRWMEYDDLIKATLENKEIHP